jgi:hypothetical protein
MYLGPFKWPSRPIWVAFLTLVVVVGISALMDIDTGPILLIAGVVVLIVAARQRAAAFSLDKTEEPRCDD